MTAPRKGSPKKSSTPMVEDVIATLKKATRGKYSKRVEAEVSDEDLASLKEAINHFLDHVEKRVFDSERLAIETNLGVTECVKALSEIRHGNMNARVGEIVLAAENDLVSGLGTTLNSTIDEIQVQLETIRRQQLVIQELSTPILQVWDDVLVLPVIGLVDSKRAMEIMERLLAEIVTRQSRYFILDITGVEIVDTATADHFIKLVKAAELLGSRCILTGIRPAVAQTLVEIGIDLSSISTMRNLKAGLQECLRLMGRGRKLPTSPDSES